MDVWRLRIVADADAEAAASAQDIFATPEPPVQASWIAAKLDEPKDALQRGEIDREYYEHEHDELLEDEAEDQRLQAEGWAYDEERGDYWHPVHGWGEDHDPEEPANRILPLLDSTANADDPPPFADMLSPPSDFPAAHDLATAIDQPPPLLHIAPDLDELTHAELIVDEPVYIVPPHPMKHQQRKYRSSSAKPAPKNRRSAGRRSCSCPNFRREPTPHLVTPTPPAPEPDEPWVLQTSTDPVIITAAAEMAADLHFVVVIPKVRPSIYSTGDSSDGPDDPDHEHHAVDQTRTSPAASSSSTEQVEDLILWDPRVPSSTGTTPTSSPTPTPLRAKGPTLHSSRYSESVARARAISDVRILDVCWDGLFSGQFETSPSSHLAFPKPGVPTHWVLQPYDEKFYPGCLTRTFQELKFLGTDIGKALRTLSSTFGVTCDVLAEIIDDCSTCMGCKCRFSRDGFNDHIRAGLCGNWPTPPTIAHVPRPERLPHDLALRELPPGKQLGTSAEFLDSPIGAALMEWNSRLGVPSTSGL
ncbi:hypothetical protein B0H14DRAFT_3859835 [Mycena olivaceomarginata]|nr:hypothetical protein B0H14DRAFT_3859835 [Mycena olivaceomarginata]